MLKRRRGRSANGRTVRRRSEWNILGTDNGIPRVIENRENVIAKAMFVNRHLPCKLQRVRPALIFCLRVESGEKSFGEFREIHVRALERATPKNKISDQ